MKEITINKIESITIELWPNGEGFHMTFNGEKADKVLLMVPKENALHAARALTRLANDMWATFDNELNYKQDE